MLNKIIRILILFTFVCSPGYSQNIAMPGAYASIVVGDINGDDEPDILFGGNSSIGSPGIAINKGGAAFSLADYPVSPYSTSAGWLDLNNDARLDYFMFGSGEGANTLYLNNGQGSFSPSAGFGGLVLLDPDVSVIDVENDGDADLFISGWDVKMTRRYSDLFLNDGNGAYTAANLGIIRKGFGSSAWADVNGDGYADLLLNGDGDNFGDAGSFDIYRLYLNNGNATFSEKQVFSNYRQISVGDGSRFADWNNDGYSDIILTGWSSSESRQATCIFLNDGTGNFSRSAESDIIPGVSESSVEVADMDKDGRIDLLLTGYSGNYGRRVALVYFNNTTLVNKKPTPPANLSVQAGAEQAGLSWTAGTDTETPSNSLSYNISLRNVSENKWVISPNAITSGPDNGFRKISGMGNAFLDHSWNLTGLPEGKYAFSVQSVDASYAGSVFPPEVIFCIKDTARLNLLLDEAKILIALAVPGTGMGNYPAVAIASLQDSINKLGPWIDEITREAAEVELPLSAAINNFRLSKIAVDVSGLSVLIDSAFTTRTEAVPGDHPGSYPVAVIDALDDAILKAQAVKVQVEALSDVNDIPSGNDLVSTAIIELRESLAAFYAGSVKVNTDTLRQGIDSAISLYNSSVAGNCQGNYPAVAKRELAYAIDSAWRVSDFPTVSQAGIDQAVLDLGNAVSGFNSSQVILDNGRLKILIDSATFIYDNAVATDYQPGARFNLAKDIYTAGVVYKNNSICSDQLNSTVVLLEDAITAFNLAKITGIPAVKTGLLVYPNPVSDKIFVAGIPEGSLLKIHNLLGIELYAGSTSGDLTEVDASAFSEGIYFIVVKNTGGVMFCRKFIIKRS